MSSMGNALSIASRAFRAVQSVRKTVDRVQQTLEILNLLGSIASGTLIQQLRTQLTTVFNQWGVIPRISVTARLLDSSFWGEAVNVLAGASRRIVASVVSTHGLALVRKYGSSDPFVWVIYMPTPADIYIPNPTFTIPLPGVKIGRKPVVMKFGGGGGSNRGRLFGLGIRQVKQGASEWQLFRMDYHGSHGKTKGDADYFEDHGPHYSFHFHIRQ